MSITPEQAAHETRKVVVTLASRFMTDPATYVRGAELGFEGMDFYASGRGGVLGDVTADVAAAAFVYFELGVVREAWARGQLLAVHGWIYKLTDGLLRDLGMCVTAEADLIGCYESALAKAAAFEA